MVALVVIGGAAGRLTSTYVATASLRLSDSSNGHIKLRCSTWDTSALGSKTYYGSNGTHIAHFKGRECYTITIVLTNREWYVKLSEENEIKQMFDIAMIFI